MATREQYRDWKMNSVTQELMDSLRASCEQYIAKMINRMQPDPYEDQFIRAYARLTDEVLNWVPEFVTEEQLKEVEDVED